MYQDRPIFMTLSIKWLGLALFYFGLIPALTPANTLKLPFKPGEELVFRIKWGFIPAGTAVLKVLPPEILNGKPANHFSLVVKSNGFVDSFYKVRSQIDSWTDIAVNRSLLYKKKQEEGRHRRNVVVTFDWPASTVRYNDYIKKKARSATLLPGSFDPLSAAYYFRMLPVAKDSDIVYPVCDGKKCVVGRGRVVDREIIDIGGVRYDTWVIIPELKNLGGVFKKSKKARIKLWVTADHRRLPVRLTSKVIIGSFVGELIQHTGTVSAK